MSKKYQIGYYTKPLDERHTEQDHMAQYNFTDDDNLDYLYKEIVKKGYYDISVCIIDEDDSIIDEVSMSNYIN